MAGSDVRIISCTDRRVNISGIDNHQVTDLKVVSCGGVNNTNCGLVIGIFHQYAYMPTNKTIHLSTQLEHFKNSVDDKSLKAGGKQHIWTPESFLIPLNIVNGLPYMRIRPYRPRMDITTTHCTYLRPKLGPTNYGCMFK